MYQKHRYTKTTANIAKRPSKILAILALSIAITLPFGLVKLVNKHKAPKFARQALALPQQRDDSAQSSQHKSAWRVIRLNPGESLSVLFSKLNLSSKTLYKLLHETQHGKMLSSIKANQDIQILIKQHHLVKLIIPLTSTEYLVISKQGAGYTSKINQRKMNSHNHYVTAIINGSLYATAKHHNIPYSLIQQMSEIFTWQINFARDLRAGDHFSILYKAYYIDDKLVTTGDIQAISYTNQGKTYQAVRYEDTHGEVEYYTPKGTSLKKAFSRYPVRFSHISSTFSLSRYHPILHYARPHKGIDLAAPIGTPIRATGNGQIDMIGRQNGFGNMIIIKHDATFSSLYGHMLKFQKGLSKGSRVKRGDIIGYVGQSGLASGPHCHYEFHVRNQPKNPTTVDLPRASSISKNDLARFKHATHALLAHLKLYENAQLAGEKNQHSRLSEG